MNTLLKAAVLGMSVLAIQSVSQAAPLNLGKTEPDIWAYFVGMYYTATTDTFIVVGGAPTLQLAPLNTVSITSGLYNLSATVDGTGYASAGTLTVTGTIASLGYNSGTLLTGTLVPGQFGYGNAGSVIFEFVFNVTGGDAQDIWGSQAGVIVDALSYSGGTAFPGHFNGNFGNVSVSGNYGSGAADTFSIPEPASVALLGMTGLTILSRRRR